MNLIVTITTVGDRTYLSGPTSSGLVGAVVGCGAGAGAGRGAEGGAGAAVGARTGAGVDSEKEEQSSLHFISSSTDSLH